MVWLQVAGSRHTVDTVNVSNLLVPNNLNFQIACVSEDSRMPKSQQDIYSFKGLLHYNQDIRLQRFPGR